MTFTYDSYTGLLDLLEKNGYETTDYHNWEKYDKCVILRHDVDTDLQKTLEMAELEHRYGIKSTYFVLLTSNFYNPFSNKNREILNKIKGLGHTIGLHFDEAAYPYDAGNAEKVKQDIRKEISVLSEILGVEVVDFSYHRPTKAILDADIEIPGMINSYGILFFREFKYLSDSRMRWREPVEEIIQGGAFLRLQILTHPFWYCVTEKSMEKILGDFINGARAERYDDLNDNFTDLNDVIDRKGIGLL